MLPKINNKSFLKCNHLDLSVLIDNPDYRENEYIDYKKTFAFLEMPKGKERNAKISEFKSDVCSFANSEGGYLIFGISDENGCAKEIIGVEIPNNNTDKYELDLRNKLNGIYPKTPYLKFHFVRLQNEKYVIVIFVQHDNLVPYTYIEDENNYRMYKRSGNGKQTMTYTELKNMFNQSLSLDSEIYKYRTERIQYYRNHEDSEGSTNLRFLLLHIIPETFIDSSYNQNMFVLESIRKISFYQLFDTFCGTTRSIPCVSGLRCWGQYGSYCGCECIVNNNGVVECFMPLDHYIDDDFYDRNKSLLFKKDVWNRIVSMYNAYCNTFKDMNTGERFFVCISIIGCKGVISEFEDCGIGYIGKIDRNVIISQPVVCEKIDDAENSSVLLDKMHIEFLSSIGVKNNRELHDLIDKVYNS